MSHSTEEEDQPARQGRGGQTGLNSLTRRGGGPHTDLYNTFEREAWQVHRELLRGVKLAEVFLGLGILLCIWALISLALGLEVIQP